MLHDVFAVSFDDIAPIVGRSVVAARQLASRARRRVQDAGLGPELRVPVDRQIVDAFLAAARDGEFEALLELLDPHVVLHMDVGDRPTLAQAPIGGAREVAQFLKSGAPLFAALCRPAIVNGGPGIVVGQPRHVIGVVGLSVVDGRIREIDIVADRDKLTQVRLEIA